MLIKTYLIPFFLLGALKSISAQECVSRDYGYDGTVCVCTADYCDTISKPVQVPQPQYLKYTSNLAGLRFFQESGVFDPDSTETLNEIRINSTEEFQTILGWGGAFTDATGINIQALDPLAQDKLLKSYFSEEGIEYSLCRVPIGGTDFSTHGYSYNDGVEDPDLINFQLAQEDFDFKIPFIQIAKNMSLNLRLFASAWTAPKWMKTNNEYDGVGFLKPEMYQSWANYFLKFLEEYDNNGIEFWGITTQNEPSLAMFPLAEVDAIINSVGWLPLELRNWVGNNLGPTLERSKFANISIMALDDQRWFLPWYVTILFANETVNNYIDGIAYHWYSDDIAPIQLLNITHDNFPSKYILSTEACDGHKDGDVDVKFGSWQRGEGYATDVIENLRNWVTGWIDWNMVLSTEGGPSYISNYVDSPVIVNASAGEFYKQPMYYCLGHFAKFVPPDSIRVYSNEFDPEVPSVTLKRPDGGRVIVILNKKAENVLTTIVDDSRGRSQIDLSPKSITTILYW